MAYFIDANGNYYEGDRADYFDEEVTQRPDSNHTWNGAMWVIIDKPFDEKVAEMKQSIQMMLDGAAVARGYFDITSACSYAGCPNPYQAEAIKMLEWRAACWNYAFGIENDVKSGKIPFPTATTLLAELPVLAAP